MKSNYLKDFPVTVPAGGIHVLRFPGSLFVVRESSAGFDIELDDSSSKTFCEGGMWIDTGVDRFGAITIYNRSTTAVLTADLRIGTGSGKAGVQYDYLRVRTTKPVGTAGQFGGYVTLTAGQISAGSANLVSIPGIATADAKYSAAGIPAGSRRRQIIVTNTGSDDLVITDSNNNLLARFGGGASSTSVSFTFESDADLKIGSLGGGSPYYNVCELFNA